MSAATGLTLNTSGGGTAAGPAVHPRFFRGFMTAPESAALGLLAVAEVARARYFQPAASQRSGLGSLDPVVTGSRDRLRFESFSGCCGVYARLDMLPAGIDGETVEHGTTNVDVNVALRDALTRVGGADPLRFDVGPDDLVVSTLQGSVVERKVPLPTRWLRGFAEVQAIAAGFDARFEVSAAEAATFLRSLSAGRGGSALWVISAGGRLRLTSRPMPGAVCLPGPGRLAALRPLLRFATAVRAYGPRVNGATTSAPSTWEVESATQRLTLTLSLEPRRGFSGEGAALYSLATDDAIDDADTVSAMLAFDSTIDVVALADDAGMSIDRVRAALAQLASAGRVGYDVGEAAYFHRVLPYDPSAVDSLNPRLIGARGLVASGDIAIEANQAWVPSSGELYQVSLDDGTPASCTCKWWGLHRGDRGPCKHLLAVSMLLTPSMVEADA